MFPVQSEDWLQPVDSKNMTRTIRKKSWDIDREDKTSPDAMQEDGTAIRRKERRKQRKLSEKDKENIAISTTSCRRSRRKLAPTTPQEAQKRRSFCQISSC